jgi:predicted enzyme related to lactoylglutathione lyase
MTDRRLLEILVNVDVPDLDMGIRFYEQALGLRLGRKLFSGRVAELIGCGSRICLLEKAPGSVTAGTMQRDYRRHWTPVHLDFVVEDIHAAVARAVNAGAKLESGPETFAWGRLAALSDPFGHGLCLLQWTGRGYDEAA